MKETRPIILVTNDDGITAPGIRCLSECMAAIGDVYVVAPDSPQSGMGHAVTVNTTLAYEQLHQNPYAKAEYSVNGTPADCVKLAIQHLLPSRPTICVSGINHGSNSSVNILYSGTMSAAMESAVESIPAIGFSLENFSWEADFSPSKPHILSITKRFLKEAQPYQVLNVNIPKTNTIKGIKVCRQSRGNWHEDFVERKDPRGKSYFWLTGEFVADDPHPEDTDVYALKQGYITVVPCTFDMTDYQLLNKIKNTYDTEI